MNILFIHGITGELGDSIRVKKILNYLKISGFKVEECRPLILNRVNIRSLEGMKEIFSSLLPFNLLKQSSLEPLTYINFSLALNSLNKIIKKREFNVILTEQTNITGWIGLRVAQKASISCIVDVHGLAGEEKKGSGNKHWGVTEALENNILSQCDYLLAVSDSMKKFIVSRYNKNPNTVSIVSNGADILPYSAKFNFPLRVIYAGSFRYWEKISDYLEIAKNADRSSFKFYLLGPPEKKILSRIKQENIPIRYLGYVSRQEALRIMSNMQVGIAPSTRDIARIVASPIKILDYMSCGLPVITPRIGDWGRMIETEDCGIALEKDTIENYINALETMNCKEIWQNKSNNGIYAIKSKYNWDNVLLPLKNLIIRLSHEKR